MRTLKYSVQRLVTLVNKMKNKATITLISYIVAFAAIAFVIGAMYGHDIITGHDADIVVSNNTALIQDAGQPETTMAVTGNGSVIMPYDVPRVTSLNTDDAYFIVAMENGVFQIDLTNCVVGGQEIRNAHIIITDDGMTYNRLLKKNSTLYELHMP